MSDDRFNKVTLHIQNKLEVELLGAYSNNHAIFDKIISTSTIDKSEVLNNIKDDPHVVWRHGDYIIKLQKSESTDREFNEVIHEATIGSVIGKMDIHHFAKVVAHNFYYIPSVNNWYAKEGQIYTYVVYEYIPGVTLEDYILTCSTEQLRVVLWKLINALHKAHNCCGFTHYDLHLGNVIVSEDDEPYIIDYGSSHVNINLSDNRISIGRVLEEGNINNYSCWQHDLLKLLMFIWSNLQPDLVYATLHQLCMNKYDKLCREAFDIKESIYPQWYIKELSNKLLNCTDDNTRHKLSAKLSKVILKNRHYKKELIDVEKDINYYDNLMNSISLDNLPPRAYDLLPSITTLIEWITKEECTVPWYKDYVRIYRYRQVTSKMLTVYYDFDTFIETARTLLH